MTGSGSPDMVDATRAGWVAAEDQEIAQAIHEAEMIAKVYERLTASLPLEFAQEMTRRWFESFSATDENACIDGDEADA